MNFKKIKINKNLPIAEHEDYISNEIKKGKNLIIIGETGSGKTTQLPLIALKTLSDYQDLSKGKIIITEPRRIAATSVSNYVSTFIDNHLGGIVGYKIRFDECKSDKTIVLFMTDGILIREIQINPLLTDYSVIIIDEAHERNINSDFLIGLLIDIQRKRLELELTPLQIIVTSATLEKEKFIKFFNQYSVNQTSVIEIPGRVYKVQAFYEENEIIDYIERVGELVYNLCTNNIQKLHKVTKHINTKSGDILIFMPGKAEIDKTKNYIASFKNINRLNIQIITLHGDLTIEEQNKVFEKTNKRKIIIATNVAETSITVPGVKFVIDTGLIKVMEFNPLTGINSLITKEHAIKGLEQRKGRAGRTQEGYYFGLYTKQSLKNRPLYPTPEILRSSLSNIILIMKSIGINDVENFKFIDKPKKNQIQKSIEELKILEAIDQKGFITPKGTTMANLPLEPKIANLILTANKYHCVESICSIASFLELKPLFKNLTEEECLKISITQEFGQDFLKNVQEQNLSIKKILNPKQLKKIYKLSKEIYTDFQSKQNILKVSNSDFLTFIKILNVWSKNNMNIEWANEHYISIETLQEAYNIKNDLIDICKENNILSKDLSDKNFSKRLNIAIIESFKHNILIRQKNNLYTNIFTMDRNIRISPYSVVNKKPKIIVASEVIMIEDINSKPKLSARFVHEIDENLINEIKNKLKINYYLEKLLEKKDKKNKFKRKDSLNFSRKRGWYRKRF